MSRVKHAFTSAIADGADTTKVRPSNWNAEHIGVDWLSQSFRNLHLRTHPDNDKAANQVALLNLDEAIMDDGTRYVDVIRAGTETPLTADITVAGAGGLDTGARVASTGYEAWLIGKSSTKVNADLRLLLHRAKDYFLDQSQTTRTNTDILRGTAANTALAQGFKVATAGKVERVDVNLQQVGTIPANSRVWLEIRSDAAGLPSTTILATSDKTDATKVPTTNTNIAFLFRNPATLATLTQYHLVFQADYAISAINALNIGGSTADTYANGVAEKFDGTTWTAGGLNNADFVLKLYVTRNDTAITMPAGYDQKALLAPWFFNNSGNAFDRLICTNRKARLLTNAAVGAFTATVPTLTDYSAFLPPRKVAGLAFLAADTVAAAGVFAAGVPDGFGGVASSTADNQIEWITSNAANTAPNLGGGEVGTEFQAMYHYVTGGTAQLWLTGWEW